MDLDIFFFCKIICNIFFCDNLLVLGKHENIGFYLCADGADVHVYFPTVDVRRSTMNCHGCPMILCALVFPCYMLRVRLNARDTL